MTILPNLGLMAGLLAASSASGASLTLFAGGGSRATGPATECRLADPFGIDFDQQGNAFVCEMTNNRVIKIDPAGQLTVFAGTTTKGAGGDGGPAAAAELNAPHNLLVTANGDLLIADSFNWKIRRVDAKTGLISTFAGTGSRGFSGDGGPADQAQFSGVYSLSLGPRDETLYLADLENRRVRAIDMKSKRVRTVAGNGERGMPADGSDAATSPLVDPRAVAAAHDGRLYILERGGNALRVVDPSGKIRTVAGTGRAGPVTPVTNPLAVTFRGPKHLCVDRDDNVLVADSDNDVIRRYSPRENKITTIVGSGGRGPAFSANPLDVQLHHPHGVNVDSKGTIYVCDSYNGRVLVIR